MVMESRMGLISFLLMLERVETMMVMESGISRMMTMIMTGFLTRMRNKLEPIHLILIVTRMV